MDNRQNIFYNMPTECIGYLFSFLDFSELALVALVNQRFSQRAADALSIINTFWKNKLKEAFPAYHDFIVSTRLDKPIHWRLEYDNTYLECIKKIKRDHFANLSKISVDEKLKRFENLIEGQKIDDKHFQDEQFQLCLISLGRANQIPTSGLTKITTLLIENAPKEDIFLENERNERNEKMLSYAFKFGHLGLVKHFYESNEFNNETEYGVGYSMLKLASAYGHLPICQYVWDIQLKKLKEQEQKQAYSFGDSYFEIESSARASLEKLFIYGHEQMINYLITHDIEKNIKYTIHARKTDEPIYLPYSETLEKAEYYDESMQKNINSGIPNFHINSFPLVVLSWAVKLEALSVLKQLLKKYPDPVSVNWALYQAVCKDKFDMFLYLLEQPLVSMDFKLPSYFSFLLDARDGEQNFLPLFDEAGRSQSTAVEQHLFYQLTLPDLKLNLAQIQNEKDLQVLFEAMQYVLETMDVYWEKYLNKYHQEEKFFRFLENLFTGLCEKGRSILNSMLLQGRNEADGIFKFGLFGNSKDQLGIDEFLNITSKIVFLEKLSENFKGKGKVIQDRITANVTDCYSGEISDDAEGYDSDENYSYSDNEDNANEENSSSPKLGRP